MQGNVKKPAGGVRPEQVAGGQIEIPDSNSGLVHPALQKKPAESRGVAVDFSQVAPSKHDRARDETNISQAATYRRNGGRVQYLWLSHGAPIAPKRSRVAGCLEPGSPAGAGRPTGGAVGGRRFAAGPPTGLFAGRLMQLKEPFEIGRILSGSPRKVNLPC